MIFAISPLPPLLFNVNLRILRTKLLNRIAVVISATVLFGCTTDNPLGISSITGLPKTKLVFLQADLDSGLHRVVRRAFDGIYTPITQRSKNGSVTGHYSTKGGHTVTFSAIEKRGGVYGEGQITGPVYMDVRFDIDCVNYIGNRMSVAGRVTSVDLGDNPYELPLNIDWLLNFAVESDGEDANADSDLLHGEIYLGLPGLGSFCNILAPDNSGIWAEASWLEDANQRDQTQIQ